MHLELDTTYNIKEFTDNLKTIPNIKNNESEQGTFYWTSKPIVLEIYEDDQIITINNQTKFHLYSAFEHDYEDFYSIKVFDSLNPVTSKPPAQCRPLSKCYQFNYPSDIDPITGDEMGNITIKVLERPPTAKQLLRKLKGSVKATAQFNKLHQRATERVYAPGGIGAIEAQKEFEKIRKPRSRAVSEPNQKSKSKSSSNKKSKKKPASIGGKSKHSKHRKHTRKH